MNKVSYKERKVAYHTALIRYGKSNQLVVALEELSEVQKEICKAMRGKTNLGNLAEEIADATIMLEQMRLLFNINDRVCEYMDQKVVRLDELLKRGTGNGNAD